jgi:hypothetical protein
LFSGIAQAIVKLTIFMVLMTLTRISANTLHMSPKEMRVRADECERLANSLTPTPDDLRNMLREIAAQ